MLTNLKSLVVVLVIAWAVFSLVRPMCVRFMAEATFVRRRNVWLALTVVAFVSPTFWVYGLFAMVLLVWATKRDDNPLALFVLVTFVIPNVRFYLSGLIVNQLFDITQYRILSLAILVPTFVRILKEPAEWGKSRLGFADVSLLAFLLLQIIVSVPFESATNTLRRSFLLYIDTFLVFYCFSRVSSKERIDDVMVCFWLSCAIMAPIAIFEYLKGWLLYTGLASLWGDPNSFAWLFRGGSLRAQAAAGHSINLGYVLAVSLGLFMYLRTRVDSKFVRWLTFVVFATALFATGSRGAWITGTIAVVVSVLLRPNAGRQLLGSTALAVAIVALMYVTPLKESVLDRLPIIGNTDQDTVEYRQQLATVSWQLIKQHPFFGDPFVYLRMESLRQGQGIIDIVNGYIYTALFAGCVGLLFQLTVFLLPIWRTFSAWLIVRSEDIDACDEGAALLACMIATLAFIATAGFGTTTYILCGLLMSYATVFHRHRRPQSSPAPRSSASPATASG